MDVSGSAWLVKYQLEASFNIWALWEVIVINLLETILFLENSSSSLSFMLNLADLALAFPFATNVRIPSRILGTYLPYLNHIFITFHKSKYVYM